MTENERSSPPSKSTAPTRPSVALPPRPSVEALLTRAPGPGGAIGSSSFSGLGLGFSPGPMTLVSNLFSDSDDCKSFSFSQLLAGAMSSPATGDSSKHLRPEGGTPPGMFAVPPGLSPAALLDSPGFFPSGPGPIGTTHQQVIAQFNARAHNKQNEFASSSAAPGSSSLAKRPTFRVTYQQPPSPAESREAMTELSKFPQADQRAQHSSYIIDKPADDGYNWRKYGQKQVKGSEFPRSYYKCTNPSCPVKKKVERSLDGQITEIVYKGQHNHQPPQNNKRGKDAGLASLSQGHEMNRFREGVHPNSLSKDQESSQATGDHLSGTSDSEDAETGVDERNEDGPEAKKQRTLESGSSHSTMSEPKIIVQTTSEVDLLDDGYRWRKYGQKVVKRNPYPRSYYKCTTPGCNVRKHVERASSDPKAVITTYEGKHNHDVPAAKTSSHSVANSISMTSQLRQQNAAPEKHDLTNNKDFGSNSQQSMARLRLKEEKIT